MMSTFKTGDRVEILLSGRKRWHHNNFGDGVGVVTGPAFHEGGVLWLNVKWDGGSGNCYPPYHLALEVVSLENE